jgi:SAM-dependent methyltransferase
MVDKTTDADWERWGQVDPYFGVYTQEKYRSANLTEDARAEFFESGREHVEHVLAVCRKHLDPEFKPRRIVDLGCGTGRLVIPFAAVAEEVVGLDVADSMLEEARRNCEIHDVDNVLLLKSDDGLSALEGTFDLVHSFVVFQHIPANRGQRMFGRLLEVLEPGGIASLQLTYSTPEWADTGGVAPSGLKNWSAQLLRLVKAALRRLRPVPEERDPGMQMNPYDLNRLFYPLHALGVREIHTELSNHAGFLGVHLSFQKPEAPPPAQGRS